MERPFHPDDIVAKKSDDSLLGVVERTHADVDTHEPYPQRAEEGVIKLDRDISQAAFRKFLKDGIPPKDTVLIRWQNSVDPRLIPASKLKLLDRSLLIGDVVKKNVRDAMSGVVINTSTKCTLQPIYDVPYKCHTLKGLLPPTSLSPGFERPSAKPPLIKDVPASELREADSPNEEDLVIYKDWIGRVDNIVSNVVIKLTDNCVVEISDDPAEHADGQFDAFAVGDIAVTKKGNLRNGKWVFGRYKPNTPPVGTVVELRPVGVEVTWLQRRIGSAASTEPPKMLERDDLDSHSFKVYDRTRWPSHPPSGAGETDTTSNSEIDVRLGLRVRFKDLAGACVKYENNLTRTDRSTTLGYDVNVFDIERFETDVTIQWQDLSITTQPSIDLVPDQSIDDEHAVWPGEIAHSLDVRPVEGLPGVEQPGKVGVVQGVDAGGRMARVRWAEGAVVQYSRNLDDEQEGGGGGGGGDGGGFRSLLTGAVGVADGEVEEVSLYDIEAPAGMNARRGDIVLVAISNGAEGGDRGSRGVEWVGEIVDTCLDGTLVVRLGAADDVRDVVLRREDVIVAVRSDGTGDFDGWDDDVDDDDDSISESLAAVLDRDTEGGKHDSWDEDSDGMEDEDEESEEARARYEDENGVVLEEEDVEGEEWESGDEGGDGDEEMVDAGLQGGTPPTSTSATPPDTRKREDDTGEDQPAEHRPAEHQPASNPSNEPPQYLVLDEPVPPSHHYATSPSTANATQMKRVQKEHRILQRAFAIPPGVYIRTWEARLDLLRALFIGPAETPYAHAPFVLDFYLPPAFPAEPPQAFFHSWPPLPTSDGGVGGRVNPNLYEDGKICLSLLGTWEGSKGEGWNAGRSTVLQVVVSLLGLVLVREPYFNEAGYEALTGLEASKRPSAVYSERAFLRARGFVITALSRLRAARGPPQDGGQQDGVVQQARDLEGLEEVVKWAYVAEEGPRLIDKVVEDVEAVLGRSEKGGAEAEPVGLEVVSKGACIPLRRVLERLRELR